MPHRYKIPLVDIEEVNTSQLSNAKINALLSGFDSFEDQLRSEKNPIALDKNTGKPFKIIDGRHRIYIARKKQMQFVPAILI